MNKDIAKALASGATVITANNRLARDLHKQYGHELRSDGHKSWSTPDIQTLDAWLQKHWLAAQFRNPEDKLPSLLPHSQALLLWEQVIRRSTLVNANVNPVALARLAAKSWSLMHRWSLDTARLQKAAVSPDQAAFVNWADGFAKACADKGWVTAEQLPSVYSEYLAKAKEKPCNALCLTGFDAINPAQQCLFNSLAAAGVSIENATPVGESNEVTRSRYPDQQVEMVAAARWAKSRIQAAPGESIAVLVPGLRERSAAVRRTMMDELSPDWRRRTENCLAPLKMACAQPLSDVGMISTALRLLRVPWQPLPFSEISLLLRSPYLRDARTDAMPRAKAELKLRDAGIVDIYARPLAGKLARWAPDMANLLLESPRWPAGEKRLPSNWASEFAGCLRYWGWPGEQLPENAEFLAYRAWENVLDQFASCDAVLGPVAVGSAHRILRNLAAQEELHPDASPDAVQVMDISEAAGLEFDHLWISGLTAEAWPPSGRVDALIAPALQRELQMPDSTPALTHESADKLINGLVAGCPNLVLSWPGTADGEAVMPAPLSIEGLVEVEATADDLSDHLLQIFESSRSVINRLNDDPPPAVTDSLRKGGSALFARQATCPARAFVEHRLGVRELPRATAGLDPRAKGKLMHKALQLWYQKYPDQSGLTAMPAEQRAAELRRLVQAVIEPLEQKEQGVMAVVTAQEALRLQAIIESFFELEVARLPFHVIGTEESVDGFGIGGLKVDLQLDRLDKLANGDLLVIDYKSSEIKPGRWAPPRPADAQLPLYAITGNYSGIAVAAISSKEASLKGVGDGETGAAGIKPVSKYSKVFDESDWDALVTEWKKSFETLAEEFLAGDFRINLHDAAPAEGEFGLVIRTSEFGVLDDGMEGGAHE